MALRLLKRCKWWYNYDMDSKRNGELSVIKNVKLDRRVKVTNHIEVGSENMQLGWIDFSKEDRQKALDVINLLSEQGAVDELGIGIIRDAFANYFFPGTSTIQTRAKYFLIVPYVLREAVDGRYEERILRDIQNGITLEKLNMRKRKKTPEEKAAVLKMKRKQRRAKSRL